MDSGQTVVTDGEASAVLSTGQLPILLATWSGSLTSTLVDRYFDAHYATLRALDREGRRCVLLTLGLAAARPSPVVRGRITERMGDDRDLLDRVIVSNAVVVESTIVRGAMIAMGWVDESLRVPMFATEEEAFAWAHVQCDQYGL
ncbi:MAG: hypothetical protein KUG77_10730 [Nannocystaceae bacterium]|nr:hypothetical protein [Nannocystaceae bacterium]